MIMPTIQVSLMQLLLQQENYIQIKKINGNISTTFIFQN